MHRLGDEPIWTGGVGDLQDQRQLHSVGVEAVVELAADEPPARIGRGFVQLRFPLVDNSGNDAPRLRLCISTVAVLFRERIPTLVTCSAGLSRTPTVVAAAWAIVRGIGCEESLREVAAFCPTYVSTSLWKEVSEVVNGNCWDLPGPGHRPQSGSNRTTEPSMAGETIESGRATAPVGTTRWLWIAVAGVLIGTGVGATWLLQGGAAEGSRTGRTAPVHEIEVVAEYPHDRNAYCQGLVYHDEEFYESTGHYGQSTVRRVEIASGRPKQLTQLGRRHFGEGLVSVGDELIQLTWKARLGLVYDRKTLRRKSTFRYTGQGWGLTHDGTHLVMSDGTSELRFLDPKTFRVARRLPVRDGSQPVDDLNELEYVDGEILANVWYSDFIARIDPKTGRVLGWIDCSQLFPARLREARDHVLNGIAWDAEKRRLFVTGKNWPRVFQIRVKALENEAPGP